ncbi:MAG: hypothetical protein EHM58_00235 [Ignavibacteriae bacterium]|nr:MAG: hypothetical protein EHM58_00235 [Ignavibacteriota bacterium]
MFNTYKRNLYKKGHNGKYLKDDFGNNIVVGKKMCFYWYEEKTDLNGNLLKVRKYHMPPAWINSKTKLREYMNSFKVKTDSLNNRKCILNFKEFASLIIKEMQNSHSKGTRNNYRLTINYFLEFIGNKPINMYCFDDINKFKNMRKTMNRRNVKESSNRQANEPISPVSVNIDLRNLHHIFRQAVFYDYLVNNPCDNLEPLPIPQKPRRIFNNSDASKIINAIKRPKMKAVAIIAFNTGMRLDEILHLQFNDFVFSNRHTIFDIYKIYISSTNEEWQKYEFEIKGYIRVENKPGFTLKDYENREVILTREVFEVIFALYNEMVNSKNFNLDNYIFGKLYNKQSASHYLNSVIRKLGFPKRQYVFHSTRHTCFTNWLHNGISLDNAQKMAGHADIATTSGYLHPDIEIEREKINNIKYSTL